jgi:hypothetical protein
MRADALRTAGAGPVIWLAHLGFVYAATSIACGRGHASAPALAIAAATALALLACGALGMRARRAPRGFYAALAAVAAGFSVLAIVWTALPAVVSPSCAGAP